MAKMEWSRSTRNWRDLTGVKQQIALESGVKKCDLMTCVMK
jgi:hypothetical protein